MEFHSLKYFLLASLVCYVTLSKPSDADGTINKENGFWMYNTSRSESGGGEGLLFLLPRPRDLPSELRRNLSASESLMGVVGLWIVLYSAAEMKFAHILV